jgi:3-methyladenine DNA glycosylase AlkD
VDTLAEAYGRGIILETYRWAELEQLVYSPSRWERRLVGSTVATLPFVDRTKGRTPDTASRGLGLLGELIGDAEPDVQKALSWALRNLTVVDPGAVSAFCEEQTRIAAAASDGHRAWVIRDTLAKLDADLAARLRHDLDGVRRRSGSPPTSRAAATAARFGGLPDPRYQPEPPLL